MTVTVLPRSIGSPRWIERIGHWLARPFSFGHREPARRPLASRVNGGRWEALPGDYPAIRDYPAPVLLAVALPGPTAPLARSGDGPGILHLGGIWRGTVAFESSEDGTDWLPVHLSPVYGGPDATETACPGIWRTLPGTHARFLRLRVTALHAGTIAATLATAPSLISADTAPLNAAA